MNRTESIKATLSEAFAPDELLVKDQSHLHAGHAGAKDGKGHFEVLIVADAFRDKSRIERHRMVFGAIDELMKTEIHALRIRALTPEER